jgi:hypothetical protein
MINFLLDSGAFSADSSGNPIDLWDYIEYLNENLELISTYVVLDVIGNAEATWNNQAIMEEYGFNPLPVYHTEDDIKYLYKCMEYPYFALGGMAGGIGTGARKAFLDKCFSIICDTPDHLPKCDVHGFGLMSPELMTRYPFKSIDTSSWVSYPQYGMILIPKTNPHGNYQWNKTPNRLFITARSPRISIEGTHIQNITGMEREKVLDFISEMGFCLGSSSVRSVSSKHILQANETLIDKNSRTVETVHEEGISNNNVQRYLFCAKYFFKVAESCPDYPWPWQPKINRLF